VIGIPFSKIETSNLILLIVPKKIETLEEIHAVDESRDLRIQLPNPIEPFSINFEIFKKDCEDKLVINHEGNILGGYIAVTFDDKDYGLRFYLQSIKGKSTWPSVSFSLARIG
jgi:hypothetical protein